MTTTFGFIVRAQQKIEAAKAEAAKVAEAAKTLVSIRNDLDIRRNDYNDNYIDSMNNPVSDEQFRDIAEKQINELQGICYSSLYLQELGLQQYINKDLTDIYQTALKLEAGNPDLQPMLCIGYIAELLKGIRNSDAAMEHIESFGKELCNGMYRSLVIMGFYLEIENVRNLLKEHSAEEFHNFMETKVAELDQQEEHMSYML